MLKNIFRYYSRHNLVTKLIKGRVARLETLNDQQLYDYYNSRFLELINAAFSKSIFYQKLYSSLGLSINDIKRLEDIEKLPIITKELVRDNIDNILVGSKRFKYKGFTSGTSGTPLTVYRSPISIITEQAYLQHYRCSHGFNIGQPIVSLRGVLGREKLFQFDRQANILYISSFQLNNSTISTIYKLLRDFRPLAIEAYPSSIHNLAQLLVENNLSFKVPLIFTSSETLYEFQRQFVEKYLSTKIFDWYGNAERTIAIAQNSGFAYKPLPGYSINEYLNAYSLTTSLINFDFPLIRYRVDDVIDTVKAEGKEAVINPFIRGILGRSDDAVVLKDGTRAVALGIAFKGCDEIRFAQIYQFNNTSDLEIKLVVSPNFSHKDLQQLEGNLIRLLGNDIRFQFKFCSKEDLITSNNGKYRLVINNEQKTS